MAIAVDPAMMLIISAASLREQDSLEWLKQIHTHVLILYVYLRHPSKLI